MQNDRSSQRAERTRTRTSLMRHGSWSEPTGKRRKHTTLAIGQGPRPKESTQQNGAHTTPVDERSQEAKKRGQLRSTVLPGSVAARPNVGKPRPKAKQSKAQTHRSTSRTTSSRQERSTAQGLFVDACCRLVSSRRSTRPITSSPPSGQCSAV